MTVSRSLLVLTSGGTLASVSARSIAHAGNIKRSTQSAWWSTHWKWVLMLIVVFVGLALLAVVGVWWRRRLRRKRDWTSGPFDNGIASKDMTSRSAAPPLTAVTSPYAGPEQARRAEAPKVAALPVHAGPSSSPGPSRSLQQAGARDNPARLSKDRGQRVRNKTR